MRLLPTATRLLVAAAPLSMPAFAHHSLAMFDLSQDVLIEGTIERFDWVNPHMYMIIETIDPDGEPALVEGEGLAITQAIVDGLDRDALLPGTRVVMRANPHRSGWGKQVRILDVMTEDGRIHPFYEANTQDRALMPSESLEGHWAPSRQALGVGFGAMASFPITPEGRAAQAEMVADGLCFVEPVPFLAVLDEMRSIEIVEDEVVMHFDNSGDHVFRTIHMDAEHPADVQASRHGHSIGRWDGDTLVIDTVAYEPNASGLGGSVPSSPSKHTVERLTLTDERIRLSYEITVEDPMYLTESATFTQYWDHRPDLEFSPASEVCDEGVAARYLDHVPE